MQEKQLSISVMYLSHLTLEVKLLVNLFSKLYVTFILQWIAFIFGKDKNEGPVGVKCARETTLTFFIIYLSPLKPKSYAGHNSHTVLR